MKGNACIDNSSLLEYDCGIDLFRWDFWNLLERVVKQRTVVCEFGCVDGACIAGMPSVPPKTDLPSSPERPIGKFKMLKMLDLCMKKRGVSDVVATVLIIAITILAVVAIWIGIIPMLNKNVSLSDLDLSLSEVEAYYNNEMVFSKILNQDESMETVYVSVTRGNGESNLTGLKFVFTVDGNSYSCIRRSVPGVLETSVYAFKSGIFSKKVPEIVEVVPLVVVGKTEKIARSGYQAKIFNTLKVFSEKVNECGGFCCTDEDLPTNPVSP